MRAIGVFEADVAIYSVTIVSVILEGKVVGYTLRLSAWVFFITFIQSVL